MGTATQWKLIMLDWAFHHDLAMPSLEKTHSIIGGLSRLLSTGYSTSLIKNDANSLYPSTILTWNIRSKTDIMGVMNKMLRYVLSQREYYKGLKKKAAVEAEKLYKELLKTDEDSEKYLELSNTRKKFLAEKINNDNQQLILKKLGNSFFGSFAAVNIFPFGDLEAAEKTTSLGRMQLRVMIHFFSNIGKGLGENGGDDEAYNYKPVVGDSFTGDTPLFIKYDDTQLIDIKPVEELIGEVETDALGREYDYSEKPYTVLCRSGWVKPKYIYRHKTDKQMYSVEDEDSLVDVTEDHSLFNDKQEKIKPSEINNETRLEYYKRPLTHVESVLSQNQVKVIANMIKNGTLDRVPVKILNLSDKRLIKLFVDTIGKLDFSGIKKTCRAGIMFLKRQL
jgi:hypothetical protein